jgi:hypothetical protein
MKHMSRDQKKHHRRTGHASRHAGFSIVEILIASAIGLMIIPAIFAATLGVQSNVAANAAYRDAIGTAERMLEDAHLEGALDFNLVNATTSAKASGSLTYGTDLTVTQLPDFLTKRVSAIVSWMGDHGQQLQVTETTLVTNLENVNSPTTCNSSPSGDWKHLQRIDLDFGQLVNNGVALAGFDISDVEAHAGKLYVLADAVPSALKSTLFIFDLSDPRSPTLLGSIDNAKTIATGLNALVIASTTDARYAFLASANDANFRTCAQGPACSQFQTYIVTDPSLPLSVASSSTLISPGAPAYTWGTGGNGQAEGKSIFYKDGYLYLGLTSTANGPAFHIFDVHAPLHPVWVGSWPAPSALFGASGAPINAIYVRGKYAYLAHPNGLLGAANEQITILDISDPANPYRVGGFGHAAGIGGNGKSAAIVGNVLYLGRTASNISGAADILPEFYTLDMTDPFNIPAVPLGSIAFPAADSANSIIIRDSLAYILTNKQFQVWNIADPAHIYPWTPDALASEFASLPSGSGAAMDCEGNYFYIVAHSSPVAGKDTLSIITSGI